MEKSSVSWKVHLIFILLSLGLLTGIIISTTGSSINSKDSVYISGTLKLEESQLLSFKNNGNSISGYVTYLNSADEILVRKIVISSKDDVTYKYADKDYTSFIYKAEIKDDSIKESELYLEIGNDSAGRIEGLGIK